VPDLVVGGRGFGDTGQGEAMTHRREWPTAPEEGRGKPLKDVDAAERAFFIKGVVWLLPVGVFLAFMVTIAAQGLLGLASGWALLLGLSLGLAGPLAVYGIIYIVGIGGTSSLLRRLYGAGTSGTPMPPTYWRAQALLVRGSRSEALQSLEADAAADPDDPGPCLRAASLCLEELHDRRAAVGWYLRARSAERITAEADAYVTFRLSNLYEELGETPRAMVELRRLLELHPESPYAQGARDRLVRLKHRHFGAAPPPDGD
jgi:hypothetical protein